MVDGTTMQKYIGVAIGATVLMSVAAALWPEVSSSGDDLNTSGIGLGNLFAGAALGILFGAGVFYAIYKGLV